MKKKKVFTRENARIIQSAVKRRFGNLGSVDIKEDNGLFRIIEKTPERREIHVEAKFEEREEKGEKLTGLSFSSEAPVRVWGEDEILLHGSDNADFSRLMNVGAILKNHNPAMIVGVPVRAWIDEEKRGNLAMRWGTTETALEAKKEALEDKSLRGVSVGYSVREFVYLKDASETYQNVVGPAWVATKWEALEASLTPVPADPSVGLERMVRDVQAETKQKQEVVEMKRLKLLRAWKASDGKSYDAGAVLEVDERTFTELTEGDEPLAEAASDESQRSVKSIEQSDENQREENPADDARKAVRDAMREEAKRASEIRTVCKRSGMPELADELIAEDKSVEEAQRAVLDAMVERQKTSQPDTGSISRIRDGVESFRDAVTDGLLLRDGKIKVEKPAGGADQFRGMSLLRMAEECLREAGIKVPSDNRKIAELALRGSETISGSTSDFPLILSGVANKTLLDGYQTAAVSYPFWALSGSLGDFKTANRLKFSEVGKLEEIPEGEKYTHTAVSESGETIKLGTFGRTWTMTRQGIINDDLSAFTRIAFSFGMQARYLPNDLGLGILNDNPNMSDSENVFSDAHGNIGNATARRIDTLAHADAALRYMINLMAQKQSMQHATEADSARYLNLRARTWLVAQTDELLARQVVRSSTDTGQDNAGVSSPFEGLGIQVVPEQNIRTSAIDYKHFLFADPRIAPVVEIAFLQGNQMPYMEMMDQTDVDGRKWLVRLDCGAAAVDHVGAVLEVGTD